MVGLFVVVMAIMACAVGFSGSESTSTGRVSPQPELRVATSTLHPPIKTIINTEGGHLRLRNRPDAAGPTDSQEVALMDNGTVFMAEACDSVNGQWWAYGWWEPGFYSYKGTPLPEPPEDLKIRGWADAEFLEPNPCE